MGPSPTLCTHLADALATSTRGRNLCIYVVYAKHMGTCTRRHRWRPQRGCVEDTTWRTSVLIPGGSQKHIKIEFTRCPGRCETHPSLSLASGHEDVAPANDVRGDVGRRCVYDRRFGERKGFDSRARHLSSSALQQGHLPLREKKEKRKTQKNVFEKLISIAMIVINLITRFN